MARLETERLILRDIDPDRDFEAWARALADEDIVRYLWKKPLDRANAWRNMAMCIGHTAIRGYGFFSIEEKATGEWVGRAGPWFPEGWPQPEVGWLIAKEHWRKGYASEAGQASIDYAFNTLGWNHVIHMILEGNEASAALAKKLGSRFIKEADGLAGITDETVWMYGQDAPAKQL